MMHPLLSSHMRTAFCPFYSAIRKEYKLVNGTRLRFWETKTQDWLYGVYDKKSTRRIRKRISGVYDWVWFEDADRKQEILFASEKFQVVDGQPETGHRVPPEEVDGVGAQRSVMIHARGATMAEKSGSADEGGEDELLQGDNGMHAAKRMVGKSFDQQTVNCQKAP